MDELTFWVLSNVAPHASSVEEIEAEGLLRELEVLEAKGLVECRTTERGSVAVITKAGERVLAEERAAWAAGAAAYADRVSA